MNPDDVDTAPVIMKEGTHVEFDSVLVQPGECSKLVLPVTRDMPHVSLFASAEPRDEGEVVLETVTCDGARLLPRNQSVESLRFGYKLAVALTRGTEVIVEVRNGTGHDTRVGVSLVSTELVKEG